MPATAQNPSYTVFPMPPFVRLTAGGVTVDFASGPFLARTAYQEFLASYFQELAAPAAGGPTAQPRRPSGRHHRGRDAESVAAVLFTDYFVFILRQLVQAALDLYREYPYQVPPGSAGHPGRHRRPVRPGRRGHADAAVSVIAEANKTSAGFFVPDATLAINRRSARVAGRGDAARPGHPAAAHAAAGRPGPSAGTPGCSPSAARSRWPAAATSPARATRWPRSRPGWGPRWTR